MHATANARTIMLVTVKAKKAAHLVAAKKKVLGRSALTGTRVLAPPPSKDATVSVHQVRRALKTLNSQPTK